MSDTPNFTITVNILVSVIWCVCSEVNAASYTNYSRVHADVFKDYNSNVRPVKDASTTINLTVDFQIFSIDGIFESEQALATVGGLVLEWRDEILSWDPRAYNGVDAITVPPSSLWRPDIAITNIAKQRSEIGIGKEPIEVTSDGNVTWLASNIFTTSCDIHVMYYPFDFQTCEIMTHLWFSTNAEIAMKTKTKNLDLTYFSRSGEWELLSATSDVIPAGRSSVVTFILTLKRRRQYYLVNVITPVVFLSCVSPLVFALPAASGEKMGYSVTILLAYTLLLTKISETMPQTSIQTSILSLYLTSMVGISALSVILSTAILKLHHKPETPEPHSRLQGFARLLRRILCYQDGRQVTSVTHLNEDILEERNTDKVPKKKRRRHNCTTVAVVTWKLFAEMLDLACFIVATSASLLITISFLSVLAIVSGLRSI